jgi:hypothetical protein
MTILILGIATLFVMILGVCSLIIAREYGADQKLVILYVWAIILWTGICMILMEIM